MNRLDFRFFNKNGFFRSALNCNRHRFGRATNFGQTRTVFPHLFVARHPSLNFIQNSPSIFVSASVKKQTQTSSSPIKFKMRKRVLSANARKKFSISASRLLIIKKIPQIYIFVLTNIFDAFILFYRFVYTDISKKETKRNVGRKSSSGN
jgi:hypothetical protein